MKNRIVYFTDMGARIIKVPTEDLYLYKDKEKYLINPDVTHLQGVNLHHWKRVGNNLVEMERLEKIEVNKKVIKLVKSNYKHKSLVVKVINWKIISMVSSGAFVLGLLTRFL